MIGQSEARALTERVLELASTDQAEVAVYGKRSALTRFARNSVHQNVAEENLAIYLRVGVSGRVGMATTNRLDDDSLRNLARRASRAAGASEAQDERSLSQPSELAPANSLDPAVAECTPEQRAQMVQEVCQTAQGSGCEAFGAFELAVDELAYANSNSVFRHHAGSKADFQTVVRRNGSSGWAHDSSWQLDQLPVAELGRQALAKAVDSANPASIEPQTLPVVLEPYATADLLGMLNTPGMGAKAVADGRSWMNDRLGEQAMSEQVSIWDDGHLLDGLPTLFDSEGTAKRRVEIVSNGVVRGPVYDRGTAQEAGTESGGHALALDLPHIARRYSPLAANLFMAPGEHTTQELIASTKHGLYITRFWYTRHVHPRDCVVTGMTRDGVFLIEDGRLGKPIKDLRFTQSYVEALREVEAVGCDTRLISEDFLNIVICAPAVKLRSFRFTGVTV